MGHPVKLQKVLSLPARLLLLRPERVAEAWKAARAAETGSALEDGVLEDVLVPFLREIGAQLAGCTGSAWERTRGVLKLSARQGPGPLSSELATLGLVLDRTLELLKASIYERLIAASAVEDAIASTASAFDHLRHPERPARDVHFGGVVVERF